MVNYMWTVLFFKIAVILLLATAFDRGINIPSDSKISRLIVGKWQRESSYINFKTNGTLRSGGWLSVTNTIVWDGVWKVKNGDIIIKAIKSNSIPFSDIEVYRIVQIDERNLVYDNLNDYVEYSWHKSTN